MPLTFCHPLENDVLMFVAMRFSYDDEEVAPRQWAGGRRSPLVLSHPVHSLHPSNPVLLTAPINIIVLLSFRFFFLSNISPVEIDRLC